MRQQRMSTKQVQIVNQEIFERMAETLDVEAADVRQALETTLATMWAHTGGVLLVWWDKENGLRMNPGQYAMGDD